ncbi:MAG TPA: YbgC/FadM family acyl-CoA thioesterase [Burkholderiaceae bacterium]|nr:YbgC/FadM family acyl-CoA thioesterase [Burkholderiaceae bacterium]
MAREPLAAPLRRDFRFAERLRVRWAEVDLQKIVFNGHYLMYFDTAVAGYWRAMAMPYHETMTAFAGDFYVRHAELDYEASARYDDGLEIGMRCAQLGRSSMRLQGAVFRGEQRLVHGELVYVFADPATQTAKPIPEALRAWFEAFEARAPMVQVQVGDWAALGADAARLRRAVFTDEQGIDAALDDDGADASALHAVARNRLGLALATGRMVAVGAGRVKIGRMAVMASMRGSSVGRQVLDALVAAARARGEREVMLHAQASAVGFYRRAGFAAHGEPFEEAGIEHQEMALALK